MANRIMYIGDTYPPLRFQLAQGQQVLDLRPATSIVLHAEGNTSSFGSAGTCTALWPFQPDPNGMSRYNLQYAFADGDTNTVDVYKLFVVVTWDDGTQTFSTTDTLSLVAAPTIGSGTAQNDSIKRPPEYPYDQPASPYPRQPV